MNYVFHNAALICALAGFLGPTWISPQEPPLQHPLTPAQVTAWREDLAYMAREMARRHRNLYHTVSRERFDSAVAALDRRIPRLERHQVIVELARIVALVGDGHTNIAPTRDSAIGFRTLPVKLYLFRDGLFIRAADRQHGNLAGAKVIRIGQATPEEAYRRVRALIGQDNEMDARFFAPFLLAMPEVLHALHLSTERDSAEFVVERSGRQWKVRLGPLGPVSADAIRYRRQLVARQWVGGHAFVARTSAALAPARSSGRVLARISPRPPPGLPSVQQGGRQRG